MSDVECQSCKKQVVHAIIMRAPGWDIFVGTTLCFKAPSLGSGEAKVEGGERALREKGQGVYGRTSSRWEKEEVEENSN